MVAFENPPPEAIRALLDHVKNIAVVGFSPRPGRASHNIARQLQRFGFRIYYLNHAVWLTGPAVSVFEGEIEIDER